MKKLEKPNNKYLCEIRMASKRFTERRPRHSTTEWKSREKKMNPVIMVLNEIGIEIKESHRHTNTRSKFIVYWLTSILIKCYFSSFHLNTLFHPIFPSFLWYAFYKGYRAVIITKMSTYAEEEGKKNESHITGWWTPTIGKWKAIEKPWSENIIIWRKPRCSEFLNILR